ncbi:unnamed protein product [Calypogeia fissa]
MASVGWWRSDSRARAQYHEWTFCGMSPLEFSTGYSQSGKYKLSEVPPKDSADAGHPNNFPFHVAEEKLCWVLLTFKLFFQEHIVCPRLRVIWTKAGTLSKRTELWGQ